MKYRLQVEKGAIVAAGAVVQPGAVVPTGELWAGNPAQKLRGVKSGEADYLSTVRPLRSSHLGRLSLTLQPTFACVQLG